MNIRTHHRKKESGITLSWGKISVEGSEERRKVEDRSQKSEDRSQKTKDRSRK
ncbi:hypothetical protein [uncultured Imperialibacter sp.]|uniref:hypothetical protein n=1 Tax=uncultured Imperialibacter sp. TaxID=1672639 RepID=UPI0030D722F1